MKKFFAILLAAVMMVPGMMGAAMADDMVEITLMLGGMEDFMMDAFQTYWVDPFEAEYPNIKIVLENVPDIEQVTKTQMAAGGGPDMMEIIGPSMAAEYSERLYDLAPYVEKYGWKDIMFDWALGSCELDGTYYCVPTTSEGIILWYNEEIFEQLGLSIPTNRDEWEEVCQACIDNGYMALSYGTGSNPCGNDWFLSVLFGNYCGNAYVKDILEGKAKFTDELAVEAIQYYNDMWQKGYITDRQSYAITPDDSLSLFLAGRSAMYCHTSYMISTIADSMEYRYNMAVYPKFNNDLSTNSIPLATCGGYAVNSNCTQAEADACALFINWMYTHPENMAKSVEAGLSPLCTDLDPALFSEECDPMILRFVELSNQYAEIPGGSGYCMWTFWPNATHDAQTDNIEKVFMGDMTVEEYCQLAQDTLDKDLAEGNVPVVPAT